MYGAKPWKRLLLVAKIHGALLEARVILGKRGHFPEILILMVWKPPGYKLKYVYEQMYIIIQFVSFGETVSLSGLPHCCSKMRPYAAKAFPIMRTTSQTATPLKSRAQI